jgi:hypothetical protein
MASGDLPGAGYLELGLLGPGQTDFAGLHIAAIKDALSRLEGNSRAQPAIAVSTSFTQYDVPIGIASSLKL